MIKKNLHPVWFSNCKVICDGKIIFETGSTIPEINVDIWSGNHPFFTGNQKIIDTEGRVDKFQKKYILKEKKL